MAHIVSGGVVATILTSLCIYARRFGSTHIIRTRGTPSRCIVDPMSATDARDLVSRVCDNNTHMAADELTARLVRVYTAFVPSEESMQALSIAQREMQGCGDALEYSCCLVLAAMMIAVTEGNLRKRDALPRSATRHDLAQLSSARTS